MAWVKPIVELNLAAKNATANWVDITQWVKRASLRRGRNTELDKFGSGSATVTLDNTDRRFDPLNTSGPYYGNLLPRREVRIRGDFIPYPSPGTLVGYQLFHGYVKGWPTSYNATAATGEVNLSLYDGFALLAQVPVSGTPFEAYSRGLAPRAWLPLTDPASALGDIATGAYAMSVGGEYRSADPAAGMLAPNDPQALNFIWATARTDAQIIPNKNGPWSVSVWVRQPQLGIYSAYSGMGLVDPHVFSMGRALRLYVDTNVADPILKGRVVLDYRTDTFSAVATIVGPNIADDRWHHIAISYSDLGWLRLYVDGTEVGSSLAMTPASIGATAVTLTPSRLGQVDPLMTGSPFKGWLWGFQCFTQELSASQVTNLFAAGKGWADQRSSDRVTALLDVAGWDASLRTIDTGTARLQALPKLSGSALDAILNTVETEGGHAGAFLTTSGYFRFRNRYAYVAQTRSAFLRARFNDGVPNTEHNLTLFNGASLWGDNGLLLDGVNQYATTPDFAAARLTNGFEIIAQIRPDNWIPASDQAIVGKWNTTGNQRGYALWHGPTSGAGRLKVFVSSDGASGTVLGLSIAHGLTSVPVTSERWVRAWYVGDNGTGNSQMWAWITTDPTAGWTYLGTTTGAIRNIHPSTSDIFIGRQGGSSSYFAGRIRYARIASIPDGSVIWEYNFVEPYGVRFTDAPVTLDDAYVRNQVMLGRQGGINQLAQDTASVAAYGPNRLERTGLQYIDDNEAMVGAHYLLNEYKDPRSRIPSLTFDARASMVEMRRAILTELGDRISVEGMPLGKGSTYALPTIVEGISHDIDYAAMSWRTTFSLNQAGIKHATHARASYSLTGVARTGW